MKLLLVVNAKTKWLVAMNRSKQRLCQLFIAVYVVKLAKECRFVMKKATLLREWLLKNRKN
jgi:hypothetical protein